MAHKSRIKSDTLAVSIYARTAILADYKTPTITTIRLAARPVTSRMILY